jgi:hypothetical protein
MLLLSHRAAVGAIVLLAAPLVTTAPARGAYAVKKLVGNLNQPTYVTAAPGDDNYLYIVQRAGTGGTVGDIVRFNKTTGVTSPYFNVPGSLVQDGGLLGMTFHPDFQTNGLLYVTSLVSNESRLEEYRVAGGGQTGGTPVLNRTLLAYQNPKTQHTIDWVGFKPGAVGAERNVLYVSTGDGGIQADSSNGAWVNNGQSTTTVMGKMLRLNIDANAADAYPADINKNFAIPADNPFVNDNTGKLKEILHTGFRNPWRASFDKQNGDLYVGDVGFNTKEEVDFVKNDANFLNSRDFGWGKREGTIANPVAGVGGPSPGSINPVVEVNQDLFQSMTGGYVYRGPVSELQGRYFFGDFNSGKILSVTFDRDTDPLSFDGGSAGISNAQDMTATFNALIAANGGGGPIGGLVSFGEDNTGNLYMISIGTGNIFNPTLGTGSIYAIVPEPTGMMLAMGTGVIMLARHRRRSRVRARG